MAHLVAKIDQIHKSTVGFLFFIFLSFVLFIIIYNNDRNFLFINGGLDKTKPSKKDDDITITGLPEYSL